MRRPSSGSTNDAGRRRSVSVFGSRMALTTPALLAPATRNSITLALLITPRVMVSLLGGSFGDCVAAIRRWRSRRTGDPGNKEAVCPSSPSPSRMRSRDGLADGEDFVAIHSCCSLSVADDWGSVHVHH